MAKEYFGIHNSSAELAVTALNTFPFDVVGGRALFLHNGIESAVRSGFDQGRLQRACAECNISSFDLSITENGSRSLTPINTSCQLTGDTQDISGSLIRRDPYYQISYKFLSWDEALNTAAFNALREHHLGLIQEEGYVPYLFVLHTVGVDCGKGDIRLDLMPFESRPTLTLMISEQADAELAEQAVGWMKNLKRLADVFD